MFYGILKQAYGLDGGNILSEEEKYAILRELVINCASEQSQEGDFVEDVAKEIWIVKGGRIALEHYSGRFLKSIEKFLMSGENLILMICF